MALIFGCAKSSKNDLSGSADAGLVATPKIEPIVPTGEYTFEKLFKTIINADIQYKKDEALYIKYKWNIETGVLIVMDVEKKELDFIPLFNIEPVKEGTYTISCDNGDNSWTEDCNGKLECGLLIKSCLNDGVCATMCQNYIIYLSEITTFEILPPGQ